MNCLLIGEHVVFAVSVVLDRRLLYIAAVGEMREQNLPAQAQKKPTKLSKSAVLYLRKRPVREENILAEIVSGIIVCKDACSAGIGGGGGTAASLPLLLKPELYL